jgi:DNA repair protein RecN (Recombination protein N)
MLQELHIQNYAIIDEVRIHFSKGLNIITGETGAGKSILMGALSLILGERADSNVLVDQSRKCTIEGVFSYTPGTPVASFLAEQGLDEEPELMLRREIATNGKTRAFINDTPVTLQQLKQLASLLVDLHRQFDTLELGESDFQLQVLDALANNEQLLRNYREAYVQWQTSSKAYQELLQQKQAFTREADYHQFLFDELDQLSLREQELEELEQELKVLSNAAGIKASLDKAAYTLGGSEQPIVVIIKQLIQQLQPYSSLQKDIDTIVTRLQSAQVELQDISGEIDHLNDTIQYDEQRVDEINQRLAEGYKLLKKHGVQTTHELLQIQQELSHKLNAVLEIDDQLAQLEKATNTHLQQVNEQAATLSQKRKEQIKPLEEQVNALLTKVGMPNARLRVGCTTAALGQYGTDDISFLFNANVPAGQAPSDTTRFEPVRKVASGGELSRLMLCIKSLVASSINLPTMIFDEIDTGISGEAAKQVGFIMKEMGLNRQIICITHQPQIAGKAEAHFFVYKETHDKGINTHIRQLAEEERLLAIARMLGGEKPTQAALENAREMMAAS